MHSQRAKPSTAWIYRVAVTLSIDQIRKRRPQAGEETMEELVSPDKSPEEGLAARQRQDRLTNLIAKLPERERACLVLRDIEGLSSSEAAAILDCSEETVRNAIFRAKEKLKLWMS